MHGHAHREGRGHQALCGHRSALDLLDFQDASIGDLKRLLLRAASPPPSCAQPMGAASWRTSSRWTCASRACFGLPIAPTNPQKASALRIVGTMSAPMCVPWLAVSMMEHRGGR